MLPFLKLDFAKGGVLDGKEADPFMCAVPSHLPMMSGQLIVLSPAAVASSGT